MKKAILVIGCIFLLIISPSLVSASENNKFGISLLQPTSEDIVKAAELVNTNGDWGYVTLVIQENDRDVRKWQDIFNELRVNHLIPIIRLATSPLGEVWRRPEEKDAQGWAEFLNKLNWVVQKRYVILFNEPNHANEWGGAVDPEGYASVAKAFAKAIKQSNGEYVVMLAGLDCAAPQYPDQFWDSGEYMKEVCKKRDVCQSLFQHVDGWASHSYPNPGFSGSVWDSGKKSVRGYEYELELLRQLGIEKDLPVFITETGWQQKTLNENTIGENMKIAYETVWGQDARVQAVTPFVFKYLSEPFIGFSWEKENGFTKQYDLVKNLPKEMGSPVQVESGLQVDLPTKLVVNSNYKISLYLKNTGQGIWDKSSGYEITVETYGVNSLLALLPDLKMVQPTEETNVFMSIKTVTEPQKYNISFSLRKNGAVILKTPLQSVTIEPLPSLEIETTLFPKFISNGDNFEVQFFDKQEELVFAKKGVQIRDGKAVINNIQNVVPGQQYRIVLIGYPYLPRQTKVILNESKNKATFKRMLPFDASGDGKWDFADVKVTLTHLDFLLRFIPWYQL